MDPLLDDLNDSQREAVTYGDGPLLVVAGAGSGKTRVITRRIAWLLTQGVPEAAILGLTFTNKAAREMAARVEPLVPGTKIRLSTFHSACARFLRVSGRCLGFGPDFTIYDTADRDQLIKSIMQELDIPTKEITPALLGSVISSLKNKGILPDDFVPQPHVPVERYVSRVYAPYQQGLKSMNAMDFDDLLLNFRAVLEEFEDERERYARRFSHVLVDEFQDTNRIQYDIVRLLAKRERNLCVVGDPDQSIYSFRGAEIGNILSFPDDYPDTALIKLETNYRSTATILRFAQEVIAHNAYRHEKELRACHGEGEPVAYLPCPTGREEAQEVALQVRGLLANDVEPCEVAVFYRARFLSRALEEAFRRYELPYKVIGDVGFFERKEIKDLLAFLQVCVNPLDRISLARILNVPPRGIGKVSEEKIFQEAARSGLGPGEFIRRGMTVPGLKGKAARGIRELGELLDEAWQVSLESVNETLNLFLERTGYIDFVCRTGARQDIEREENIRELLADARHFDDELARIRDVEGKETPAAYAYLAQVSLMTDVDELGEENAAQLMTVHAAKGLEFDHVFVIGLEEGLFPHSQSLDDPTDLEEERRLFYVAATRARKRLYCLRADMRQNFEGGYSPRDPSRFLLEAGFTPSRPAGVSFEEEHGEAPGEQQTFGEGERVRHEVYGDGTILRCFGRGRSAKVEVLFPSGVRVLLVEYANLLKVEGA